jgi:hypothetical protein
MPVGGAENTMRRSGASRRRKGGLGSLSVEFMAGDGATTAVGDGLESLRLARPARESSRQILRGPAGNDSLCPEQETALAWSVRRHSCLVVQKSSRRAQGFALACLPGKVRRRSCIPGKFWTRCRGGAARCAQRGKHPRRPLPLSAKRRRS